MERGDFITAETMGEPHTSVPSFHVNLIGYVHDTTYINLNKPGVLGTSGSELFETHVLRPSYSNTHLHEGIFMCYDVCDHSTIGTFLVGSCLDLKMLYLLIPLLTARCEATR